jgi:hypothetical protein
MSSSPKTNKPNNRKKKNISLFIYLLLFNFELNLILQSKKIKKEQEKRSTKKFDYLKFIIEEKKT